MPIAQQRFNTRYHFTEMIRNWSGKEATHRKVTETIDSQGNVIDRSVVEETIYAIIGNPPFSEKGQPVGNLQSGTLCLYYWVNDDDDDICVSKQIDPNSTRFDEIDFQNVTYKVTQLDEVCYDLNAAGTDHESIFGKYTLQKIAPS